jgi:hypothetical protein
MSKPHYYQHENIKKDTSVVTSDICIYGNTPAAITAAVQAAIRNKSVTLFFPSTQIGGMTTSGLSTTDIGNRHKIGGLAKLFYKEVGAWYGTDECWFFEPHVALEIYSSWLRKWNIPVYYYHWISDVKKEGTEIKSVQTENGVTFKASIFIDASYEGDLMAKAGVSYTVGRESDDQYDENYNGVQFSSKHHNFIRFIDPYIIPGNRSSGILRGISEMPPGKQGDGDSLIQAYNFRLCITKDDPNKVPFPKPSEYDPERYELLRRYIENGVFDLFNLTRDLPDGKADHNSWGAFNSDFLGANYKWPDSTFEDREIIFQNHINYQQGLFYFCANDSRLPEYVKNITNSWGLAADEFKNSDNWPLQLYIREARRMVSDYVITEHNAVGRYTPDDSVGIAAYRMDSHNCKRVIKSGRVMNEGSVEVSPLAPFCIPYRSIRPRREECTNLLVPVCVSASHIGFGAIRMEPVFMILGQSAAIAACIALDSDRVVQNVSYSTLEDKLKSEMQILR